MITGIMVNSPCFIYGNNQSLLWNTSLTKYVLKKETWSVAYHYIREGVSVDVWKMAYTNTKLNPSDILTNNLPTVINWHSKVWILLYDTYPISKY